VKKHFEPPDLFAIGLVLLFISAVGWAITGGPQISVMPFMSYIQPDLVMPVFALGVICVAGAIVGMMRGD
jgi:hypothetical protein